jgi:hypothetical protein
VDRINDDGNAVGRLPWQADDIDGITTLDEKLQPGDFADVAVNEVVDDYDFNATLVRRIVSVPRDASRVERRSLPMASIGSYGR